MDFNGIQRVVSRNTLIIFIGLIKVIAQQSPGGWSPQTWQQQPPPQGQAPQQPGQQPPPGQPAQNPSSLWSQQQPPPPGQNFNQPPPQGQNFNQPPPQGQNFNPNQPQFQVPPQPPTGMWGPPSIGQPPPGFQQNMAAPPNNIGWSQYNPQQQMQQPPPGWPMPPPIGVQPAPVPGASVETNGNHVPQPSQWLPPGHPGHPDATKAAGPWNSKGPMDKNSPKAKLVEAINQMTVAFTQFQTTLEKLMTSLGKLTQLQ